MPRQDHGLPRIDLSRWRESDPAARAAMAADWDAAMSRFGAAVIVNHGLPIGTTSALYDAATTFFSQSHEAKMRWCLNKGYGPGGFVPQGVEAVGRSHAGGENAVPDLLENLVFSHGGDPSLEPAMPSHPPSLQPAVHNFSTHARTVLSLLLRLSASALGLEEGYFSLLYDQRAACNLKLSWYPAVPDTGGEGRQPRYGAHTDYTGFTLLRQDPAVGGLEVQLSGGEWLPVPAEQGDGLVVNAGDLIQVWSNDRWKSPVHRVAAPTGEAAARARLSLVFFTGPPGDTLVEALPGTWGPHNPKRYPPVSARAHLLQKLQVTNS